MAKTILYIDGATGLDTQQGDQWPYAARFQVAMGDEDGVTVHIDKNGGRFFSDAVAGDYNIWFGNYSYIVPKTLGSFSYPWVQFGGWMKATDLGGGVYLPFIGGRWNAETTGAGWWGSGNRFSIVTATGELYFGSNASGIYYPAVANKWFWFEGRVYNHSVLSGVAEIRINNTYIKRWTGIKTITVGGAGPPSGEIDCNHAEFYFLDWLTYSQGARYDDLYFIGADTEGELDWVDKGVCEPLYVMGDGAEIMATPIGPTSHASVEFPVNDIIYVTATAGERDCYSFSNLESDRTRTVHGVKVTARARRSYPGTATIRCYCRVNGSNYYGDTHYLSPEWREYIHIWAQNPDTSTAWTREDLDAAQFGFERVA